MSKFFANYIYLTIVLVMIQSVVTEFIYDDDDASSVYGGEDTIPNNPNDMLGQNFDIMTDVQANELGNNLFSAFFGQNSFMDIQNVVQTATPKPDFTTSFDIFKLMNKSYARKQFYCVINKEPCDSVGTRLKATIPEAMNRNCARCTPSEAKRILRVMNYVRQNYPQLWNRVEPLYRNK